MGRASRWRPRELGVGDRLGPGELSLRGRHVHRVARLGALLGAVLSIALGLASSGCGRGSLAGRDAEPPPEGEKPAPTPAVHLSYQGHWIYRFGDSPKAPSGELLWAQPLPKITPMPVADGWHEAGPFRRFPGRGNNTFLWMRTRLHGPPLHDGVLYMPGVDNLLEAYLDGRLIYRYGDMSGAPPYRFLGFRGHYLPIGTDYDGKTLSLRMYSDLSNLGPFGEPRIGERAEITTDLFIEDIGRLVSSMLLILLGITVLALYLLRRDERSYLMYGGLFS